MLVLIIESDVGIEDVGVRGGGALPKVGRCDGPIIRSRDFSDDAKHLRTHVVDAARAEHAGAVIGAEREYRAVGSRAGRGRYVVVDVAALVPQVDADSQCEHALDHGYIQNPILVVVESAVMRLRQVGADRCTERIQVGLFRDESNRAAHRARAVQRALRTAQHLDTLQIEQLRLHRAVVQAVADGHRDFVDVDADRRRSRRRTDAADLDVIEPRTRTRLEPNAWHCARDVVVVGNVMLRQLRSADRRYAERNVLDVFGALLCGDYDFLQLIGCRLSLDAGCDIAGCRSNRKRRRDAGDCKNLRRKRRTSSPDHWFLPRCPLYQSRPRCSRSRLKLGRTKEWLCPG